MTVVDPVVAQDGEARIDRRVDLAVGLVAAALGVFLVAAAEGLREDIVGDLLGPQAFPRVLGTFIAMAGLVVAVRALRHLRGTAVIAEDEGEPDEPTVESSAPRAFALMGATLGYAFLLDPLGYPLVTPLYLAASLWLLRVRNIALLTILPLGMSIACYYLFAEIFHVPMPTGLLTEPLRQLGLR